MVKEKETMGITPSTLTQRSLDVIIESYLILREFSPTVPDSEITINRAGPGQIGVYYQFMLAGLRFPAFDFLGEITRSYQIHLSQISPNGFRKIVCFVMLCSALGIKPEIEVFRYFYCTMSSGDWIAFSSRSNRKELCGGTQDSIKKWKNEFFFVNEGAFPFGMEFGLTKGRPADLPPTLSETQGANAALLEDNAIMWKDPSEIILGMAGLSPSWNEKDPINLLNILKAEYCPTEETVNMEVAKFNSLVEKTIGNKPSPKSKAKRSHGGGLNNLVPRKKRRLVGGGKSTAPILVDALVIDASSTKATSNLSNPVSLLDDSGIVPEQHPIVVSTELQMPPLVQKGHQVEKPDFSMDGRLAVDAMDQQLFGPVIEPIDGIEKYKFSEDEALDTIHYHLFSSEIMPTDKSECSSFIVSFDVDDVTSSENGNSEEIMRDVAHVHSQAPVADGLPLGDGLDLSLVSLEMGVADVSPSNSINGNNDTLKEPEVGMANWLESDVGTINSSIEIEKLQSAIPGSSEILLEKDVKLGGRPINTVDAGKISIGPIVGASPFHIPFSFLPLAKEPNHFSLVQGWNNLRESLTAAGTWFNKIEAHSDFNIADMIEERDKYEKMEMDLSKAQADRNAMERDKDIMTHRYDELAEKYKVLEASNKDLNRQVVEATAQTEIYVDLMKDSFVKKISELEAGLKEKDDKLQWLENQLCQYQEAAECYGKQLEEANNERLAAMADCSDRLGHASGHLEWMLKEGIPYSVQHLLRSEEFGRANTLMQLACIDYGLHKGSVDMKNKYPDELASAAPAHFHPNARDRVKKCFAALVTHEFSLLADLKAGKLTLPGLKELLLGKKEATLAVTVL
ncbi:hypothetical protein L1887_34491 [Cichorium endivia]|nr:hypothetical protein L1887_34491 [Cichorium endivia]